MEQLLFSQGALYQLQQLVQPVRAKTGVRHRLADQKDLFSLLRYSCTSTDPVISDYYAQFIAELDEQQKAYLQCRGLLLSRIGKSNSRTASEKRQQKAAL